MLRLGNRSCKWFGRRAGRPNEGHSRGLARAEAVRIVGPGRRCQDWMLKVSESTHSLQYHLWKETVDRVREHHRFFRLINYCYHWLRYLVNLYFFLAWSFFHFLIELIPHVINLKFNYFNLSWYHFLQKFKVLINYYVF